MTAKNASPSPNISHKVFICYMSGVQDMIVGYLEAPGYLEMKKASNRTSITKDNACYSLKGAEYTVYDSNGKGLKELELQQSARIIRPSDGKPKLEVWQQYLENGEYLRAAEVTEEQNYNMIDGRANNRAPRRSIIERLQEKQSEVQQGAPLGRMQELIQEDEIERSRK